MFWLAFFVYYVGRWVLVGFGLYLACRIVRLGFKR